MRNRRMRKLLALSLAAACVITSVPSSALEESSTEAVVAETQVETAETAATEAPATEAPATEAPVTEAPATEAPATEAPATEAPATEAPATEAPVTEAPVTEASATETTVTEAPSTEAAESETAQEESKQEETYASISQLYGEDEPAETLAETSTEAEGGEANAEFTVKLTETEETDVELDENVKRIHIESTKADSDTEIRLYLWDFKPDDEFPDDMDEWNVYLTEPLTSVHPEELDEKTLEMEIPVICADGTETPVWVSYEEEKDKDGYLESAFLSFVLPEGAVIDTELDLMAESGDETLFLEIVLADDNEEETILDGISLVWEAVDSEETEETQAAAEEENIIIISETDISETETETVKESESASESESETETKSTTEAETESETEESYGWVEFVAEEGGSLTASFYYEDETYEAGTYTYDMMEYGPWEAQFETSGVLTVTAKADDGYEVGLITVTDEDGNVIAKSGTGETSFMPHDNSRITVTAAFTETSVDDPELYATAELTESGANNGIMLASSGGSLWWMDNYYVNESDSYYVEETDDFTLKYQIEFHASEELDAGTVEIRIPAALYTDRYGEDKLPDDIGVPEGTPGDYTESTNSPFNWYLDDTTGELVFWNYRTIKSGSNASFQVLYKNIDIMDVVDGTTWSLTPTATVEVGGNEETASGTAMTGLVDTGVVLTSVTKSAYYATGKKYTPALYTENQVSSYIDGVLPDEYSGDNFDNYKYVVWKITVKGDATQPWSLSTEDITSLSGMPLDTKIVGYKWLVETSTDYAASYYGWSNGTVSFSDKRSIKMKFYVVTAYPVDSIKAGDKLENTITQTIVPVDGIDPEQSLSASAEYTYVNYDWTYSGNIIGIDKWADSTGSERTKTYSAWLDVYENNQAIDADTVGLSYHGYSRCYGYGYTHNTLGANQVGVGTATNKGDYIPGTYYQVTTYDDVVYAYPNSDSTKAVILDDDDYYFSSVKFVITDYDYDIYEDTTAAAVTVSDVDQGYYIYAMFSGSDTWELVDSVSWDGTGSLTYTFSDDAIAREPYRVKAVHNATGYVTYCWFYIDIALKYDSPKILAMQAEYGSDLAELNIENICGVSGEQFTSAGSQGFFHDQTVQNGNYSEEGLEDLTKDLYGMLLMRDSAFDILTRLEKSAQSTKYGVAENDSANSRVLVDYYLTAYEGYIVPDEDTKTLLQSQGVSLPDRDEVVYYDLLPYGMKYNASAGVTAGRITTISGTTWYTQPRAWDQSDITVTVGDDDVIQNWNGTGRTMVVFHIKYTGDAPSVYSYGMWLEGYGLHFQAYYDWADMGAVNTEYNLAAYMPEVGDTVPLYGSDSEVYCDDTTVPTTVNDDYSPLAVEDINGDGITDIRNILYARNLTVADVATAATNSIVKLVKADDDPFASFTTKTAVGLGRGYTYEITVTNPSNSTMSNIVIFDVLEDALYRLDVAGETVFEDDTDGCWVGTYTGLITEGLTSQGIEPVIWYNQSRSAVVPTGSQDPAEVLTAANGWVKSTEWTKALSEVRAIAVDISNTSDGGSFTLETGESVSFQISMTAPDTMQAHIYAYNNPSFYSVSTKNDGSTDKATVIATAVRVELAETGTIEVEKEFGNEVPDSFADQEFTFNLKDGDGNVLANQKYQLYNYDSASGTWSNSGVVLATDIYGKFTLTAGQKAVFENVPNYKDVTVTEEEHIFFDTITLYDDSVDGLVGWTFKNTYRPVVYATKKVNLLNNDIDTDAYTFTYRITVWDDAAGDYVPLANSTYYYVSEASEDGTSVEILGSGQTNSNGEFSIKAGEIIALFPGEVGTEYKIEEVDSTEDFFAVTDTVTGTVTELGQTASITNIYKYRYLTLTKTLSGYDAADCDSTFTFVITDSSGNPVAGARYVVIDSNGNEVTDVNGVVEEGVTGADGSFTLTGAGTDRRIRIYGLLYNESYTITETDYDETLYSPVNDGTAVVTMGTYTAGKTATIQNKYLLKDLEVSKLVVSNNLDASAAADLKIREFTFTLEKLVDGSYEVVADAAYTVNGVEYRTGADGTFTLKNGETASFDDVGYAGDTFRITEEADAKYTQVYPANKEPGSVTLTESGGEIQFLNGDSGMVSIEKQVTGLDSVGEAFVELLEEDNTAELLSSGSYTIPVTINVYNGNTLVTNGSYSCMYIAQAGDVTTTAFTGTITIDLRPFDQVYLSGIPDGYTVTVTESSDWELVYTDVTLDTSLVIESDYIISEAVTAEASATAGEEGATATVVNSIGSANKASEIYKAMTDASADVATGAKLVWQVQKYNGSGWEAASGIRYILMDDTGATSGILTTGSNGKITLTKTDNGYPYVRFVDDVVYANVYSDMASGDLRIVEVLDESDDSWGMLSSYESSTVVGSAITVSKANTFINANDSDDTLTIEKVMEEGEGTFTFQVTHVLSATDLPITSETQVLASEPGANLYYAVYDSETDEFVTEGYTDENGQLSIEAGQYAVVSIPDDTVWQVYELQQAGYELVNVEVDGDNVSSSENTAYVQEEKELRNYNVKYAVSVYGIDTEAGQVTFGPATGASYISSYVSKETIKDAGGTHSSEYCIHDMTWTEIAELAKTNPEALQSCLENGCTKSVDIILNDTLLSDSYTFVDMDDGDGASVLYSSIDSSYRKWNSENSSSGGWPESRIRAILNGADGETDSSVAGTDTLRVSESLLSCFPTELQNVIVAKAVESATVYNSQIHTSVETTYDKLWLFSYEEYFNYTSSYALAYEGTQYARTSTYFTSSTLRKGYNESSSAAYWWLRSVCPTNAADVYRVNSSGYVDDVIASGTSGVAPGFILGNATAEEEDDDDYTVKYAVSVYGIQADTYLDDGGNEAVAGLTFGPATGASYLTSYVSKETVRASGGTHDSEYCIHDMTWEEIAAQSQIDPTVFDDCLRCGCTKSVNILMNSTIGGTDYYGKMDEGDGASVLYSSVYSSYRKWNDENSNEGGWPASKIRATLNGADSYTDSSVAGTSLLDSSNSLLSCFPEALQNAIVAKAVDSNTQYDSQSDSTIVTTYDKLWLFSYKEIANYTSNYALAYEGTQYARTASYFNTTTLRVGYYETGSACYWWLRSPYTYSAASVYGVYSSGGINYNLASSTDGVAPGFSIR